MSLINYKIYPIIDLKLVFLKKFHDCYDIM